MSSVLSAPVSPCASGINDILDIFNRPEFRNALKGFVITLIEEDTDFRESLRGVFDYHMATSELKVLKRLSVVETDLGRNDLADFEEEREPNIPEKIEALKEEIQSIEYKAPVSPIITLEPTSKTEVRADLLVKELKESGKDHLTSHEIIHFLKSKLPDNCKVNEKIQNIRKVKQDVLRVASQMYPNVLLSKKKTGHKEVRLILSS